MKNFVVCTLFENTYHYGVAALINSLYKQGYQGDVYVGYRGSLPKWADGAKANTLLSWPEASTLDVLNKIGLHFLPITTNYHLTNYKPHFMLKLMEGPAKNAKGIAYFDPDIVVKSKWNFFENWMSHGVALVHELANNPMPFSHPIRLDWKKVVGKCNKEITHQLDHYFNGGFCGVSSTNLEFLQTWQEVIEVAITDFDFKPDQFINSQERTFLFQANDQDALNIAAMCCTSPLSEVGPEGMDFKHGGWIMSHATGSPKPWKKPFIRMALRGISPTIADREFWTIAHGPIKIFKEGYIKRKNLSMALAAFIGRFYRRK